MKKLFCLNNPPLSYEFMLHEGNDGHPAAKSDCPDLQKCECEGRKRKKRKLLLFGFWLTHACHRHSPMVRKQELVLCPKPSRRGEFSDRGY